MIQVLGVHPVEARQPAHLIEIAVSGGIEWDSITQSDPSQPRSNWQAPYDERELGILPDGRTRAVFFFHYLDLNRPLETADGEVPLVAQSPLPDDLKSIEYEEPS